jgi:general secretion pathway protein L
MQGTLEAAAAYARDRDVILLVPGLEATTTCVNLPVTRQSRIQQMLPYSLEDAVAEDIDKLMFAASPKRQDGSISVAIVAHHLIQQWLDECHDAGLQPKAVYVDVQGVPETPGNVTILLDAQRIFGRVPEREPFVFEDLPLTELVALLASHDETADVCKNLIVYSDDDSYRNRAPELEQLRDSGVNVELSLLHDGVLARLAATLVTMPGSNLLQGPYAIKSDWSQLLRPWRMPGALAASLVLIATVSLGGRYFLLSNEDDALAASLQSNCQAAFQTANLGACESEIRGRLAVSGQGPEIDVDAGFLGTLGTVATSIDARMVFQNVSFRNGVMNLSVIAPDVQSLDSLATAIGTEGRLQANIQSAVPGAEGVEGRLQIAEVQ